MIFTIRLEENGGGNMPDLRGRVFNIKVGGHRDLSFRQLKFRVYKLKWLDLDPKIQFLKNYTEMWHYRTRSPQLYLGDMDYKVN